MAGLVLLPSCFDPAVAQTPNASVARPLITIIGELTYRERIALPPGATLLVTLTEPDQADPDAPTLARQRIDLAGQQVPLRFRLTATAVSLKAGRRYAVRAVIHDERGRPLWSIRSAHVIDPGETLANLGVLMLTRVSMEEADTAAAPAIAFQCGEHEVTARFAGDAMELHMDGVTHRLSQALSASGARYTGDAAGQPLEFWNKGREARLTLGDTVYPRCLEMIGEDEGDGSSYEAHGYGPAWTLRIAGDRLQLVRIGAETTEIARIHLPERQLLAGGYRYAARLGDVDLKVTVTPGLCLDRRSGVPFPDQVTVVKGEQRYVGCGGDTADVLRRGEWRVTSLNGETLAEADGPTIAFMPDGTVTGRSGCNRFLSRYRVDAEGLSISGRSMAGTMMACPAGIMRREQAFLAALGSVERHAMDADGALTLTGPDDVEIVLKATGP